MSIIKAIILGIVQGITEFLPISSSGHLSLFQHFMGVSGEGSLMFSVLLHVGTLIAVFIVFYKTIFELVVEFFSLLKDIFTGKFKFKELKGKKKMLVMFVFSCIPLLLLLIPVGNDMKLMDLLGGLSEDDSILVEGVCFTLTGIFLHMLQKNALLPEVSIPLMLLQSVLLRFSPQVFPEFPVQALPFQQV